MSNKLPLKRDDAPTLKERLTGNAYDNILPSRYLRKDENGNVVESQEELFERVARNIAVAEAVHHEEEVTVRPQDIKSDHPRRDELADEVWDYPSFRQEDDFEVLTQAGDWIPVEESEISAELTERNAPKFDYESVFEQAPESVKEQMELYAEEYQDLMETLRFMPNSPTLMNAGDELQQLSACFVDSPTDDISGIHQTAKEAAEVFQSGGGMGYAFTHLRPYGDSVGSTGGIASGPITFMRTFDQMCETIAQGGARRGAQMGVMRVSHPDIVEFVHAKNKDVSLAVSLRLNDPDDFTHTSFGDALEEARGYLEEMSDSDGNVDPMIRNAVEGHLSNFNISVGVTDTFMEDLKAGEDFTFTNPRTGEPHVATHQTKEMWERYGLGEHVEVGEELTVDPEVIWERIIDGAHENGEPGVVFLERMNKEHSFDVEKYPEHRIHATNPCGEQPLEEYEACNLGHINLSTVVSGDAKERDWREWSGVDSYSEASFDLEEDVSEFLKQAIDWNEFNHRIELGTRFLDSVVTMSDFPVDKIEDKVRENRKIGLGIMGFAQMLPQLGIRYGSDVGNEVARQIMTHINHESKRVSHDLADERGSFDNWRKSKYANPTEYEEWFEKYVGLDAEEWEDGFPVRNHNTTTIAPTGTTSMIGNTSGGCEPIYNVAYYKNVSDDVQGEEMLVEFDDYFLRFLEANDIDVEAVKEEAEEQMENNEFDGVDGLDRVPDKIGELFVTTNELSAEEHAYVQCAFQEGVDSAISKTVNAPKSATKEDTREAFELVYDLGGKGVTYYRDGTRTKQVQTTRADNQDYDEEDLLEEVRERAEDSQFRTDLMEILSEHSEEASEEELEEFAGALEQELEAETTVPWYDNGHYAERRERPNKLPGETFRVQTGYGFMYLTVNVDESGRPFEIIANMGDSGGFTNGFIEAMGKTLSNALRSGVDPEILADDLVGINAPEVGFDSQFHQVNSIPEAFGKVIRHVSDTDIVQETPTGEVERVADGGATQSQEPSDRISLAPGEECWCDHESQRQIVRQEGCKKCKACGWSQC